MRIRVLVLLICMFCLLSQANDLSEIQQKIDNASAGETITIPDGTYTGKTLIVNKDINLIGESQEGVIISPTSQRYNTGMYIGKKNKATIENITIKCNPEDKSFGSVLVIRDSSATIKNCKIVGSYLYGILIENANAKVYNTTIRRVAYGIGAKLSDFQLHDSNVEAGTVAIYSSLEKDKTSKPETFIIDGCTITKSDNGFYCNPNSSGTISNSSFIGCKSGMKITRPDKPIIITNNKFTDIQQTAIQVYHSGTTTPKITISGNLCEKCNLGIWINEANVTAEIKDNTIKNADKGILAQTLNDASITGNRLENIASYGINCQICKVSSVISGNTIKNTGSPGIYAFDGSYKIENNTCSDGVVGIRTRTVDALVKGNKLVNNKETGLYAAQYSVLEVIDNVFEQNESDLYQSYNIYCTYNGEASPESTLSIENWDQDKSKLNNLLMAENFSELESEFIKMRQEKKSDKDCNSVLEMSYSNLCEVNSLTATGRQIILEKAKKWQDKMPEASTPLTMLSIIYNDTGWRIRGSGYGNTVSDAQWVEFNKYVKTAILSLNDAISRENNDAVIYSKMIGMKTAISDDKDLYSLFKEGVKIDKYCIPVYISLMNSYLPKWGGSCKKCESFAKKAANMTKDEMGDGMYARLAGFCLLHSEEKIFDEYKFDYDRIKNGYYQLLEKYPDSNRMRNALCFIAHKKHDTKTAKEMIEWIDKDGEYLLYFLKSNIVINQIRIDCGFEPIEL